ncbi:MAG TPA: hypothetical protein VHE77_17655 [Dongiaceae bacterium]|jgi:predicted signal transduction protein with EAL and GGDEF domain|nr:hypothetical protein [Dongiaceae bacterium]
MTATTAAAAVAIWLALQVPIGMAIGCYIRHAQAWEKAKPSLAKPKTRRFKHRPFGECPPAALFRG